MWKYTACCCRLRIMRISALIWQAVCDPFMLFEVGWLIALRLFNLIVTTTWSIVMCSVIWCNSIYLLHVLKWLDVSSQFFHSVFFVPNMLAKFVPLVLWRCWFGDRKGIRPVKTEWWGTGMVICLDRGANDLHMVQLMPLPSHHRLLQ